MEAAEHFIKSMLHAASYEGADQTDLRQEKATWLEAQNNVEESKNTAKESSCSIKSAMPKTCKQKKELTEKAANTNTKKSKRQPDSVAADVQQSLSAEKCVHNEEKRRATVGRQPG